LDNHQRQLVGQNLGLVAVHLRRFVPNLRDPRRDRDWDDLFQEGCLGLMQAAASFREERGIPFAAYALPRIHCAVSRALHRHFATVTPPPRPRTRRPSKRLGSASDDDGAATREREAPRHDPNSSPGSGKEPGSQPAPGAPRAAGRVGRAPWNRRGERHHVDADPEASAREAPRRWTVHAFSELSGAPAVVAPQAPAAVEPDELPPDGSAEVDEMIGDRLREKYERAVRSAADAAARCVSPRGDRGELVRRIVEDRLLIPQDEQRAALRQIARETKSSYARVAQCERGLLGAVRALLDRDAEFALLRAASRADAAGTQRRMDRDLSRELDARAADAFVERCREGTEGERRRLLDALWAQHGPLLGEAIAGIVRSLDWRQRERLFS
jgi:hypothetical protein